MALLLDRGSYEISSLTNPCSDNLFDNINSGEYWNFYKQEQQGRNEAGLEHLDDNEEYRDPKLPVASDGEGLIQSYPYRLFAESDAITQWHNIITTWIPAEVKKFLLHQAALNKYIDEEPEYFLDSRIRELIFAHEPGDVTKPLGVFALINVYSHERKIFQREQPFEFPVYWEGRLLAVEESRRGEGIGEALVISALYRAIKSNTRLSFFVNTSNPDAAKLCKKLGGDPRLPQDFRYGGGEFPDIHRRIACWSLFEEDPSLCMSCPRKDEEKDEDEATTWFWETRSGAVAAIEPLEQWIEQPTETRNY